MRGRGKRGVLLWIGLALALPLAGRVAAAGPPPATATPERPEVRAALPAIAAARTAAARRAAVDALLAIEPTPIVELNAFLGRTRRSTEPERRAVLAAIGADLPDDKGKFRAPDRQAATDEAANDAFDWLAKLLEL